jgi:imidazole glycerol-phosphate synthase subunit HisH
MTKHSEEGNVDGLNWIQADTVKFVSHKENIKIPHMGWSDTFFKNDAILADEFVENPPRFYYVHSYYIKCHNTTEILCQANYADMNFDSGFVKENIMGVQFHPEKSHVFGKEFLKQFLNWNP